MQIRRHRVHIPASKFTAVSTTVFDDVICTLRGSRHATLVYFVLYHHAWHKQNKTVSASLTKLSKWTGLDYRTVQRCIKMLQSKGFIVRRLKGTLHSRHDVPVWDVPAARFDMGRSGWVPVPSFIFTEYLQVEPSCVLLPILLFFQNRKKLNHCWPGVPNLSMSSGWVSIPRVYKALSLMSKQRKWDALGTSLPRPLSVSWKRPPGGQIVMRHLSVRAICYFRKKKEDGTRGRPELFLTKEFSEFFGIRAKSLPKGEAGTS